MCSSDLVCDTTKRFLSILRMLKGMQTPTILLWTGASISELEHTFDEAIKAFGFIQSLQETCICKKVSGSTTTFLIGIYG